jgi:hypothetical protein
VLVIGIDDVDDTVWPADQLAYVYGSDLWNDSSNTRKGFELLRVFNGSAYERQRIFWRDALVVLADRFEAGFGLRDGFAGLLLLKSAFDLAKENQPLNRIIERSLVRQRLDSFSGFPFGADLCHASDLSGYWLFSWRLHLQAGSLVLFSSGRESIPVI